MSRTDSGAPEQGRIEQNVKRAVGKSALKQIRGIVEEERRAEAANALFSGMAGLLCCWRRSRWRIFWGYSEWSVYCW